MGDVFRRFLESERAGGMLLAACAVLSLSLANSPWHAQWQALWNVSLGPLTLQAWINDALMAVFFLLVGLELEREIYVGELSDFRAALLPAAAAIGGMVVPAAIHYAFTAGTPWQAGAGIPMATDIAFALAAIAVLGERVPLSVKIFVTAFAVMDDLGAILVIALAYSADVSFAYMLAGAAVFFLLVTLNRLRVMALAPYLAGGALLWFLTLRAGVHPTVSGVLLAFAIPFSPRKPLERSPSHRVENFLHKPVAFGVLPLFALANTGVALGAASLHADPNALGIALGLLVGKPLGITVFCVAAIALGLRKPHDMSWSHLVGAGILGGIGFTMSIFIAHLAFPANRLAVDASTLAVMVSSLAASLAGVGWLALSGRKGR